jgi:peptide chain release factor 1
MNQKLLEKLEAVEQRHGELESLLADPKTIATPTLYSRHAKEHGSLGKIVARYHELKSLLAQKEEAEAILADKDQDRELKALAKAEEQELTEKTTTLEQEIQNLFVSEEPDAQKNVIMEIRAGTGGEEAGLFAGDLFRMYTRYAESRGWKVEVMDSRPSDLGGIKEVIFSVEGPGAYQRLRYESGAHRVQRVPVTEASGRIHTSAATVAVLPEAEDVDVQINPGDLRIETFRSSGPGGQHVNKTSSGVRIIHEPTGTVVECQDERSQHKNRARAMRILRSRLYEAQRRKLEAERAQARRSQIGSGDRSEKIRTYNFPDNRVTDHRINLSVHDLKNILDGALDKIVEPLMQFDREERLKEMGF